MYAPINMHVFKQPFFSFMNVPNTRDIKNHLFHVGSSSSCHMLGMQSAASRDYSHPVLHQISSAQ